MAFSVFALTVLLWVALHANGVPSREYPKLTEADAGLENLTANLKRGHHCEAIDHSKLDTVTDDDIKFVKENGGLEERALNQSDIKLKDWNDSINRIMDQCQVLEKFLLDNKLDKRDLSVNSDEEPRPEDGMLGEDVEADEAHKYTRERPDDEMSLSEERVCEIRQHDRKKSKDVERVLKKHLTKKQIQPDKKWKRKNYDWSPREAIKSRKRRSEEDPPRLLWGDDETRRQRRQRRKEARERRRKEREERQRKREEEEMKQRLEEEEKKLKEEEDRKRQDEEDKARRAEEEKEPDIVVRYTQRLDHLRGEIDRYISTEGKTEEERLWLKNRVEIIKKELESILDLMKEGITEE